MKAWHAPMHQRTYSDITGHCLEIFDVDEAHTLKGMSVE